VHNDALASVLMASAMYFMLRWCREDRAMPLFISASCSTLATWTKSSGFALMIPLVALLSIRTSRHLAEVRSPLPKAAARTDIAGLGLAWIILILPAIAILSRRNASGAGLCRALLGRACNISGEHFVGNQPINYLYFDWRYFLSQPFTAADPTKPQQDYFWNGILKSSLFGTMPLGPQFGGQTDAALGIVLSILLLAMILYAAPTASRFGLAQVRRYSVLLLCGACMLVLLVAFRLTVPTPFHEDFRHIFPALIPASLFFAKSVEQRSRTHSLYYAGYGLGLGLVVASIALFAKIP